MAEVKNAVRSEAAFFDALIGKEGTYEPFADEAWRTLRRALARLLGADQRALDVLDVGCGSGSSRVLYEPVAASYQGIDLSLAALASARRNRPEARWLLADAGRLPVVDASFDLVAFSSVLHHIPDFRPALREAFRVLRPGGAVFAFDPNLLHPAMALLRHPRSPFYSSAGVSPNERPLLPRELRAPFREAGFSDIRQRAQAALPYRQLSVGVLNRFLPAYNTLDRGLDASGIGRWLGPFILTFARRPPARAQG